MGETERFLDAVRFLTIVPTPPTDTTPQPDWLGRSLKYFPIVGIGIGALAATVLLLAGHIWGPFVAALLAICTGAIITAALHEDGLADTADAFGGGWSIERRLEIMKDSRIGTYGALALGFGVALRIAALTQLPLWAGALALVANHAAARATPGFVIGAMRYAGDTEAKKVNYAETSMRPDETRFALISVAIAALPLVFISVSSVFLGALLGTALAAALALWSRRLIGGYTGDVLGAIEQMFEIGFLLGVAAIIR
jgi:adenosylcobinamide-GDP ribazoletransferase